MRGISTPLSPEARNMEVKAAPGNEGRRVFCEDLFFAEDLLATIFATFMCGFGRRGVLLYHNATAIGP
jgi:hypothetical protein